MTRPAIQPEAAAILDFLASQETPHLATLSADVMRSIYRQLAQAFDEPADPAIRTVDFESNGLGMRAYFPRDAGAGPVILFMHGGGWIMGDLDGYDGLCGLIAAISGQRVVAVDYRRAPEHAFPNAHVDCLYAARFVADGPAELEAPVTGIALAGDSAGGNLAFHVAERLGSAEVLGQLLLYPLLDCTGTAGGSYQDFAEGYLLDRQLLERFIGDYVGPGASREDRDLSPLLHPLSAALPPAVILTAGLDPLRDQGRALAGVIGAQGIETHYLEAVGLIHGLATMRKALPTADRMIRRAITIFTEMIGAAQRAPEESEA